MKRYLQLLNLFFLVILTASLWVIPYFGGWWLEAGMWLGAMCTCGLVSMQYSRETMDNKELIWTSQYFQKEYRIEVMAQTFLTLLFFGMVWLWTPFAFIFGIFLMYFLNIIFEVVYKYVRHL